MRQGSETVRALSPSVALARRGFVSLGVAQRSSRVQDGQPSGVTGGVAAVATSPYSRLWRQGMLGAPGSRALAVVLQPVDESPRSAQLAEQLLALLEQELWRAAPPRSAQTVDAYTSRVRQACLAANDWLAEWNASTTPDRRCCFGYTCAFFWDRELLLAIAPPAATLVQQDGELYRFPLRDDQAHILPLGQQRAVEPALYYTQTAPGDVVILTRAELGAALLEHVDPSLLTNPDPRPIFAALQAMSQEFGHQELDAVVLVLPDVRSGRRRFLVDWTSVVHRFRGSQPRANDAFEYGKAVAVDLEGENRQTSSEGTTLSADRRSDEIFDNTMVDTLDEPGDLDPETTQRWEPLTGEHDSALVKRGRGRGATLRETITGLAVAAVVAFIGVWQLLFRRRPKIAPPPDDGTFGLPRLQRYEESIRLPDLTPVRRQLPRLPVSPMTGLIAVSALGLLSAAFALSVRHDHEQALRSRFDTLLQTAAQERTLATQSSNATIARAYLETASQRLDAAAQLNLDPQRVAQERAALATARDHVFKITRLEGIQVLGAIPPAPEGVTPRLFLGNGQLYLLTDALYRLDSTGTKLIQLLKPGDTVDGQRVGTLLGAAWADGAPIAFDGANAYLFDPTSARWTRLSVGTVGTAYRGVARVGSFAGNLYLLIPQNGQILRFLSGAYQNKPEDWTGGRAADQLRQARDMQIDGRIYVLLQDGTILTFYRGALESTAKPAVDPAVTDAVALSAQPDRPYRYIGLADGRILRVTTDGTLVQQFMAADNAPALAPMRDLVVDDILGIAYILTDHALLTVHLPAAPAAGQ